jgi:hypothetical protein
MMKSSRNTYQPQDGDLMVQCISQRSFKTPLHVRGGKGWPAISSSLNHGLVEGNVRWNPDSVGFRARHLARMNHTDMNAYMATVPADERSKVDIVLNSIRRQFAEANKATKPAPEDIDDDTEVEEEEEVVEEVRGAKEVLKTPSPKRRTKRKLDLVVTPPTPPRPRRRVMVPIDHKDDVQDGVPALLAMRVEAGRIDQRLSRVQDGLLVSMNELLQMRMELNKLPGGFWRK